MDESTKTLILYLTVFLVATKLGIVIYLFKKIQIKKKNKIEAGVKFLTAISIMISGLFISRILFAYFDFILTDFDENLYGVFPNYLLWKTAMFFAASTLVYLLWVLDKTIIENKFKGIPAIITLVVMVIALSLPINGLEDFKTMSLYSSIANFTALLIPGIFFYIAKESSGEIRRTAFLIGFGILIYAIATLLVNESLIAGLNSALQVDTRSFIWILSILTKCIGLSLFAISSVKFTSE
jgi:hypothetical protein